MATWLEQWLSGLGADKADLAITISVFSLAVSAASAFYTRALAKIEREKLYRKPLVLEPRFTEMKDWPNCYECGYRVRNLEPVSAIVLTAKSKRRRLQLVSFDDAHVPDGAGGLKLKEKFPNELAGQEIKIDRPVGGCDDMQSVVRAGPVIYIRFYANGYAKPSDIKVETVWADGAKR